MTATPRRFSRPAHPVGPAHLHAGIPVGVVVLIGIAALGCTKAAPAGTALHKLSAIAIDTRPGLSGLAVDDHDILYSVAERDRIAYAIDVSQSPAVVSALAIIGPVDDARWAELDLEGIAWLGGDNFALALEGGPRPFAGVARATRRDNKLYVTELLELSAATLGIKITANHGVEGICGSNDTILVALENWRTQQDATGETRWAPIARIRNNQVEVTYLRLHSKRGKLASLDCTIASDGSAQVWTIERHYDVTLIETIDLPAVLPPRMESRIVVDLTAAVAGRRNIEGIARLRTGQLALAVDNQGKPAAGPLVEGSLVGSMAEPSEVLLLAAPGPLPAPR